MTKSKRRLWTASFLRELTMTGDARLAAERAGVDHGEAWVRRMAEPNFAAYWDAALRLREDWLEQNAPSLSQRRAAGPSLSSGGERGQ